MQLIWLDALEEAQLQEKCFFDKNIHALGYIPADSDDTTRLPIGFSYDETDDSKLIRSQLHWYSDQSSPGNTRPAFEFNVLDTSGNPIPGNSSHDYGNATLTDEDR